ncbi:substrate-binding domain-containing protein, partial [Rhizobiaceae sp. 2RAB30]
MVGAAMDHLAALGHRRFARLGFDLPAAPFRARARAFRDWLGVHDIVAAVDIEEPFGATASPRLAAALGGRNRPTAVICDDDLLAPLAYRAARQAGLLIPGDLSVVGIGDIDLAQLLDPPLTTVAIPAQSVGRAALGALFGKIESDVRQDPIVIETTLVVRGSSAAAGSGR